MHASEWHETRLFARSRLYSTHALMDYDGCVVLTQARRLAVKTQPDVAVKPQPDEDILIDE